MADCLKTLIFSITVIKGHSRPSVSFESSIKSCITCWQKLCVKQTDMGRPMPHPSKWCLGCYLTTNFLSSGPPTFQMLLTPMLKLILSA